MLGISCEESLSNTEFWWRW